MPRDINPSGELILVQRQFNRISKEMMPLKWNMKPRNVQCNGELHDELTSLINSQNIPPHRSIFVKKDGAPVCHETFIRSYYDKDIAEAGVRRIQFHDLRHTATTFLVAAGYDPKTVMEICGHKSISTTMMYVHLLADSIKKVARSHFITGRKSDPIAQNPLLRVVR